MTAGTDDKPQSAGETFQIVPIAALTFGGDEYEIPLLVSSYTLSHFCTYIAQNDVSTISTVKVNKNLATDANILMTIPANSTGTFCDNTHTLTAVSTDTISYLGNSPAGTGTLYYSSIMAAMEIPPFSSAITRKKVFGGGKILPKGGKVF